MATEEENKDPYADIRNLLYRQKPESREAEIRAERNKAKATAFLQAFGTIADAFTLSRGGDVPKRDVNPYIMNNVQKADAYREQDRADKKAWDNSWLNLQNQITQYNIHRQDLEKQRAYEDERAEKNMAFQKEMADKQQEQRKEMESIDFMRKVDLTEMGFEHNREIAGMNNTTKTEVAKTAAQNRLNVANVRTKASEVIARLKNNPSRSDLKLFMKIPNPDNPSTFLPIDKDEALIIFGQMMQSDDENIAPVPKRSGWYNDNEIITHILRVLRDNPELAREYLGALYEKVVNTRGTKVVKDDTLVDTQGAGPYQGQYSQPNTQPASPYQATQGTGTPGTGMTNVPSDTVQTTTNTDANKDIDEIL